MRYLSVCSGIEAASVAWHPLGWQPVAFSEIDKFPSAVLAHHYPDVPNLGDMTKFKEWPDADFDVLVGGTPCQSFSVAGLRKGMADPRGNLALVYLAIAERYKPRWIVWENVPGVLSSNGGRDFGSFLGGLGELGYGWAYRVLDAQFVRVDGLGRAVPQRRRRVFVVGHLGDWRRAAAVLFERESVCGHSAPRREAGQEIARDTAPSLTGSGRGVERPGETRGQDPVIEVPEIVTKAMSSKWSKGSSGPAGDEGASLIAAQAFKPAHYTRGKDGAPSNVAYPLVKEADRGDTDQLIAFSSKDHGAVAFTQNSRSEVREIGGDGQVVGAIAAEPGAQQQNYVATHDVAGTMMSYAKSGGDSNRIDNAAAGFMAINSSSWQVRRLTPRECERLQGFPDDYTLIEVRGKPAADGPRYKSLGNSFAVNVVRWIGQRIQMVEDLAVKIEKVA